MTEDKISNSPVRGLQYMLGVIRQINDDIPFIHHDGVYGTGTKKAVEVFQSQYGLPSTGITDGETHQKIVSVYDACAQFSLPSESPVVHFPASLILRLNQYHPHIYVTQAMFSALRHEYSDFIPFTTHGILDDNTAANLAALQRSAGLLVTGELNKPTWDMLARLYRSAYDRFSPPANG